MSTNSNVSPADAQPVLGPRAPNKSRGKTTSRAAGASGVAGPSPPIPGHFEGGRVSAPWNDPDGEKVHNEAKVESHRRGGKQKAGGSKRPPKARPTLSSGPDLATLEAWIEEGHMAFISSYRTSLDHARRVGQLLNQVKAQLRHGEFTGWLERRRKLFSPSTARAYMRIATKGAILDDDSNQQSAGDIGLTAALNRLVARPRARRTAGQEAGTRTSTRSSHPGSTGRPEAEDGGGSAEEDPRETKQGEDAESHPERAVADATRKPAAGADPAKRPDRADHSDQGDGRRNGEAGASETSETARDIEARSTSPPELPEDRMADEEWLATLPLRDRLEDPKAFIEDALLWRHARHSHETLLRQQGIDEGQVRRIRDAKARSPRFINRLIGLTEPHPRSWEVCSKCAGSGSTPSRTYKCPQCDGGGYDFT